MQRRPFSHFLALAAVCVGVFILSACADAEGQGAAGTVCTAGNDCVSGTCLADLCPTSAPGLGLCVGSACASSCEGGDECVTYGDGVAACVSPNVCPAQLAAGAACQAGRECESGYCIAAPCADEVRNLCASSLCDEAGACTDQESAWETAGGALCLCSPADACD